VSQSQRDTPSRPTSSMISLVIFQTGIILLHAHHQVIYYNCVKFRLYSFNC